MAYPQGLAQRPPPPRQPGSRRPPPGAPWGPPPQDGYYGQDYGYDNHYAGGGGYDDAGYGYYGEYPPPRPRGPPRQQPRPRGRGPPMEPPYDPGYGYDGRPPHGPDGRLGPPRRPPPKGDRMRPPPGRPARPPGAMGYDNPFPAFPPREKRYPPQAGVERGMAAMDLNGPPPPGRVPDRPHTSSGRRPGPGPPPASPGRSRDYPGPARSASAGRPPDKPERSYTDPSGPPHIPQFNRSATVPVNPEASMNGPMYPDPRSRDPGPDYQFDTDDLLDSYYGTAPDEPDMPNFDAMPDTQKGPIDESLPGLEQQKPKTPAPAAPAGGQYAAFSPQSASQPPSRAPTAPSQFASAGFQFDLPNEAPPPQPQNNLGYGYDDPAYSQFPTPAGYSREGSVRSNGPPRPYRVNQPAVNQTDGLDPQQNPDALPQHPVPFRPGHDKPTPVRQYASPPSNPAAPPPAMQGPPVDQPPGPVTHDELQRLQQMARNNPSDHKTQLLLAKKLVEASAVLVDGNLSDPKTKAKAREKYVMDGYKIVKKLVQSGYADAQFYLADCYGQGQLGLQVDPKEAFSLYSSAAKAGHGQSAYRVAVCCEIGQEEGGGTKRDPFKAVQWYKRAAALGDTPAMYKMGMISIRGLLGQACSPREGISWLKRAAERADPENPHALHELGLMYSNAGGNDIVVRDEGYAAQLFHQAAELGYKSSQFRLGTAYENGLMSCPVDPRQSIIYYTHAASQGEHQSELALSGWYLTGADGILQQSDTEAYLWARKAATAGLSKAEYAMGYFTEVGIGVTANLDDAKRWYWRAAAQGFPKARERLEDLKKGGARMQKTRLSRSNVDRQNEGDCVVM